MPSGDGTRLFGMIPQATAFDRGLLHDSDITIDYVLRAKTQAELAEMQQRLRLAIPQFKRQPERLHWVATINPLTIYGIAEHDVAWWYRVETVLSRLGTVDTFPFTASQFEAINAAMGYQV